jgi:hypothetical protein
MEFSIFLFAEELISKIKEFILEIIHSSQSSFCALIKYFFISFFLISNFLESLSIFQNKLFIVVILCHIFTKINLLI